MSQSVVEKYAATRFAFDTAKHEMTIKHDDGLYRHIRFAAPNTGFYWYDLITWPGWLTIASDMGTYTFSRVEDMFTFFRGRQVNPQYWGEKTQDGEGRIDSYSEDRFKALVTEHLQNLGDDLNGKQRKAKAELQARIADGDCYIEEYAREMLRDAESAGLFSDTWEWDLKDWDFHFLWCLNAIVAGIKQYDASRPAVTS